MGEANTPPALYIREIIIRQLSLSDIDSRSWTSQVRRVLVKYNLPTACQLLNNPPKKMAWKGTVRQAVTEEWSQRLQEEATEKPSLCFLNISLCEVGYLHPVWEDLDTIAIDKATVKVQPLICQYPLATSPTTGSNRSSTCPLCRLEAETPTHFLLHCPVMAAEWIPYLVRVLGTCRTYRLSVDPHC